MKIIPYNELKKKFTAVLNNVGLSKSKAEKCAKIFADNTLDGVVSHGINRFPGFIKAILSGEILRDAEPQKIDQNGSIETWDGNLGPGMLNAHLCMNRAITLAQENGIGCVALRNTTHWMRGGTYGWQAVDRGCTGICFTNTVANMPAWGGRESRLGNNPLVIAIPRKKGAVVLDMAISQYSYGTLKNYETEGKKLPYYGGYDHDMNLSKDPKEIRESFRALPIGKWKGSGLALLLDILATSLSGGKATCNITGKGSDIGVSQCFIALHQPEFHEQLIQEILDYTLSATPINPEETVRYPGERTLKIRKRNRKEGIPIHEKAWKALLDLEKALK